MDWWPHGIRYINGALGNELLIGQQDTSYVVPALG